MKSLGNNLCEIIFINREVAKEAQRKYAAGEIVAVSGKDIELRAYNVNPLPGAKIPEQFPACCSSHRELYESLVDELNRFPDCCNNHRKVIGTDWFDKLNYAYMPLKVMNSYAYTIDCIDQSMNLPDWHRRIKDYIDVTISSFGQLPLGFGPAVGLTAYVSIVRNNLPLIEGLTAEKHQSILAMFNAHIKSGEDKKEADVELLTHIYQEWLRLFPFEIPYLSALKEKLQNNIPILKGPGNTNMYSGMTSFQLKTRQDLLDYLKEATMVIINELNAGKQYVKGNLQLTKEAEIKLLAARHRLEIEELKIDRKGDQTVYLKLLKKWLKSEKKFITELRLTLGDTGPDEQFRQCLADAIHSFQQNETNEPCLMNIRNNGPNKETMVRYAVKNFLRARFPDAVLAAEEEKGTGYIDLKFSHPLMANKIMEFKGWWNYDKIDIALQVAKYLTDFEGDGYILMINHLKTKDISGDYTALLQSPTMKYLPGSWLIHRIDKSDFAYYSSQHQFGNRSKTIYHYIFNIYF